MAFIHDIIFRMEEKINQSVSALKVKVVGSDGTGISITGGKLDTNIPVGSATSFNQDYQITLGTTLNSLIETLQELTHRLSFLAGLANGGAVGLRVVGVSMPSTAVTGPITSAQSIAEKAIGGAAYTQKTANENLAAIISNINNVTT